MEDGTRFGGFHTLSVLLDSHPLPPPGRFMSGTTLPSAIAIMPASATVFVRTSMPWWRLGAGWRGPMTMVHACRRDGILAILNKIPIPIGIDIAFRIWGEVVRPCPRSWPLAAITTTTPRSRLGLVLLVKPGNGSAAKSSCNDRHTLAHSAPGSAGSRLTSRMLNKAGNCGAGKSCPGNDVVLMLSFSDWRAASGQTPIPGDRSPAPA